MEMIQSNRGTEKVYMNGFTYVIQKYCKNHIRWRCSKNSSLKCKGILTTNLQKVDPMEMKPHNHEPIKDCYRVTQNVQKMKVQARKTLKPPIQLYSQVISTVNADVKPFMPNEGTVKRLMHNQREKIIQELIAEDMRKSYDNDIDLDVGKHMEPIGLFKTWFDKACQTPMPGEPNSMALATANKLGQPSCRYVLLKHFDQSGFVFFTDRDSRKGQELEENPRASCLFYWDVLHRQIRIEGPVEKVSENENEEYFHSRPRGSQLAAWASHQSRRISSRKELLDRHAELEAQYGDSGDTIPKPERWGGYRVKPERMEFWQGHTNRLHHRVVFRRHQEDEVVDPNLTVMGEEGWVCEILSP